MIHHRTQFEKISLDGVVSSDIKEDQIRINFSSNHSKAGTFKTSYPSLAKDFSEEYPASDVQ